MTEKRPATTAWVAATAVIPLLTKIATPTTSIEGPRHRQLQEHAGPAHRLVRRARRDADRDRERVEREELHRLDGAVPLGAEGHLDERRGQERDARRDRHAEHQQVAQRDRVGVRERAPVHVREGREQHDARHGGHVHDRQLRKPEGERVEAERSRAEHLADEYVVRVRGDGGRDVHPRERAAEPEQARQLRAVEPQLAGAMGRGPRARSRAPWCLRRSRSRATTRRRRPGRARPRPSRARARRRTRRSSAYGTASPSARASSASPPPTGSGS